jgi:hypothetical protein
LILSEIEQNKQYISNDPHFIKLAMEIDKLMDFLDFLSSLIFETRHVKICISGEKSYMFQKTDHLDSTVKTLNSIKYCCMYGSFSDANVLVRKYRDDLIMFLYIVDVLENRKCLSDEQINEIIGDKMDEEKILKLIETAFINSVSGVGKSDDDKCVDAWFDDTIYNLSKKQGKKIRKLIRDKLSFNNYMKCLRKNESINKVITEYNLGTNWKAIQDKLNDYTHNNGKVCTRHNLGSCQSSDIIKICCNEIIARLDFITAFFVVLIILVDPLMIQSTEYIDYLDCGLTPPENSQYTIALGIQEFIDEYINRINPELKVFLKNNNRYGMLIN